MDLWSAAGATASAATPLARYRSDAMLETRVVDRDGVVINPDPHGDELYYNGVSMCQVALTAFDDYERYGEARHLERALKHADKFVDLCVRRGNDALVFLYPIDNPAFNAKAGEWSSGMAQALALGVMVKAHQHTGRDVYLQNARAIFESLRMRIDEGGTLGCWADGCPSIEEVAQPGEPGAKILNGFIAALTNLLAYAEYTDSKEALELFHTCLESIRHHLPEYDFGWWSAYDQYGTHASHYNETHCRQLMWCYEYTGAPTFLQHALKFASYEYEPPFTALLVEGDRTNVIAGYGLENIANPPPLHRKYFSYSGALPVTLELDLGAERYLSGLRLDARNERANATSYSILVATDRSEWSEVARRSGDDAIKKRVFFERAHLCRYIRLRVTGTSGGGPDRGWFAITRIVPTLRLPMAARGEGSSPYAYPLLPDLAGRVADSKWRQVTGHARLYYDLADARAFRGVRVIPSDGAKQGVPVAVAVSLTGHTWHPVVLSPADDGLRWNADSSPIARYVRVDIGRDSTEPLLLKEVEVLADGEWPALHPDCSRPSFAEQIATAIGARAGRLQLLGASQVLPAAARPGASIRLDVFFECMKQLSAEEPYGCTLTLCGEDATRTLGARAIRTAHHARSWEGLRFREMLRAELPGDLPAGDYSLVLDIVRMEDGQPGPSLLRESPIYVGNLKVMALPGVMKDARAEEHLTGGRS